MTRAKWIRNVIELRRDLVSYSLPFGLVRLRTFRLVHGLVRCTYWMQVFTHVRGGCDSKRCHNKNPRYEIGPGTWMTSCPEALRILGMGKKTTTVTWDLNSERGSWDFSLEEGNIYQPLRSGRIWHKVNF